MRIGCCLFFGQSPQLSLLDEKRLYGLLFEHNVRHKVIAVKERTPNLSKEKFLKGALILTVAGIIVKVIGSVNRIFLSRLLGGEGIGLYQMAYPIYLLALSISSAGIPVAISILVSEKAALQDYRGANRVFKISLF